MKPAAYIALTILVLALRVWLAFLVNKWAKRKGRTSGVWFFWAFAFLGPTALVVAFLPRIKPDTAPKQADGIGHVGN